MADPGAIGFEMEGGISPKHVTQIPVISTPLYPPPPSGEIQVLEENSVVPAEQPPGQGNLYPPINDGQPTKPAIGFEATGENGGSGGVALLGMKPLPGYEMETVVPTDVVTEKVPLSDNQGDMVVSDLRKADDEKASDKESESSQLLPPGGTKTKGEEEGEVTEAVLLDSGEIAHVVKVENEENMFFRDGKRRVDYILAFTPGTGADEDKKAEKRKVFEEELKMEGLELEREAVEKSKSGKVAFVKVHAPWVVLAKGAELMNMKMPLAPNDMDLDMRSCFDMFPNPFGLDPDLMKEDDLYFTAPFSRSRVEQFVITDKDKFFTNAQRSRIVHEILSRAPYEYVEDISKRRFGIKKMINNGSYAAAYPLHDGKYHSEHSILTRGALNDRHLLYETWARPGRWYKFQPLDQIRNYFGEKIGIYFSWLGYYTMMLIPASVVGLIVFIYGCATILNDKAVQELCDINKAGNLTMCPLCDKRCPYWRFEDSCNYSQATYLFDNYATVAFAIFMALWASFFHELWKRKQAEIEYDWDVADFEQEEETVRPEFEAKVTRRKENPINKKEEPYVPNWSKCVRYMTTITVIILFLCMVVAAVFGVIVYRIIIAAVLYASDQVVVSTRASLIASATAACINLVVILILNLIYTQIALALTNLEHHRTESEWEDAFTFKMFLFQCVNYYSSIFYIAFFKGRFVGYPSNYDYNLLGYRQEECNPAGCLVELCLQMGIIMVGKQAYGNFKELILPKLIVWFKSRSAQHDKDKEKVYTRWEQDYNLAEMPKLGLFDEYLEMVIQYGFVTIFVAAFPLAPLFALLNNIIEIRLDAYKFVVTWKRPLASRAQDIGIWFGILQGISALAVLTNGAIIAFTSEFIPKLVYQYGYSPDKTLDGFYANFALSAFNVADFQDKSIPDDKGEDIFGIVNQCRYRDFRESVHPYEYSMKYWHVLAARLAFIVIFENLIVFVSWLIMYLVPDMPYNVKVQMMREKYLAKEALFNAETIKMKQQEQTQATASREDQDHPLY